MQAFQLMLSSFENLNYIPMTTLNSSAYQGTSDYIPIAALNQFAYCPHRCWRMFCTGEFADNNYTIEGTGLHDRVHTLGEGHREDTWQVRAIWLKSERYKLIGKADLIEAQDGEWYPIEYKRGSTGEWDNDELQVCAQALCLEEMTGQSVTLGYIYYAQSHQRQPVEISAQLRQQAIATIASVALSCKQAKCLQQFILSAAKDAVFISSVYH